MTDNRNITTGWEIPKEGYCDQPYIVINRKGEWVCVMTTGQGHEGQGGQHVISCISQDRGRTWSKPVDIEPADGPEASWVVPLIIPSGRIYVFYTYNTDSMRSVDSDYGPIDRVDTLGDFMMKYSDDDGNTWSADHYPLPVRTFECDRENPYGGKTKFFWSVGKPLIHENSAFVPFSKVGRFGEGFMARSEGAFMKSRNILTENHPGKIGWETLPDGEVGLRAPKGPVSDEHNITYLSDGSLYCTYRTIDGYNCAAYSRDGGHTWTPPAYAEYTPGGRKIKHPRAANFVRRFSNGKYILWFHNHGNEAFSKPEYLEQYGKPRGEGLTDPNWWETAAVNPYKDRNPVWMCGGVERDGFIHWSQPEIVLYDDHPSTRMSYPDFIEDNGEYYISETQKTVARIHKMDKNQLEGMWNQTETTLVNRDNLLVEMTGTNAATGNTFTLPWLGSTETGSVGEFSYQTDLTLELWLTFDSLIPGEIILDSRDSEGRGIALEVSRNRTVKLILHDGRREVAWECDKNLLKENALHHLTTVVDGGARIITFIIDGLLCDGGDYRQFGWGRIPVDMRDLNGREPLRIAPEFTGRIDNLRIHNRYLRTSEIVGHFNAGLKG